MRLQKYMAMCGVASRRKSEELIAQGQVTVNGETVLVPGHPINPDCDRVAVNGKSIACEAKAYILLNKPMGVVSTSMDEHAEKTAVALVGGDKRLYTVGRLDKDTEGLLILTNDGALTQRLTHPSHAFTKTYECLVKGHPDEAAIKALESGVTIQNGDENYLTRPAGVEVLKKKRGATLLEIVISEGKNRQIRKMCEAIGHPVIHLKHRPSRHSP